MNAIFGHDAKGFEIIEPDPTIALENWLELRQDRGSRDLPSFVTPPQERPSGEIPALLEEANNAE